MFNRIEKPPSGMRAQVRRRDTSRTAGRICGISNERPPNCTPKENKQPPGCHVICEKYNVLRGKCNRKRAVSVGNRGSNCNDCCFCRKIFVLILYYESEG
jgi:hypothetical protein